MKAAIMLLFGLFIGASTFSQDLVARMKYEEAEEAYSKNDYATVISKLDEAEKLLGKTNSRILYLRILADAKIVEADPYKSYERLDKLRKNCAFFMKEYEKTEGIEDKFRDVYKINESLKIYPANYEAFKKVEEKSAQDMVAKIKSEVKEEYNNKNLKDQFLNFNYYPAYQLGITVTEAIERYPALFYRKRNKSLGENILETKNQDGLGINLFYISQDRLVGYQGTLLEFRQDPGYKSGSEMITSLLNELSAKFGFSPIETSKPGDAAYTLPRTNYLYTWEKYGHTVQLIHVKYNGKNGKDYSSIQIYSR